MQNNFKNIKLNKEFGDFELVNFNYNSNTEETTWTDIDNNKTIPLDNERFREAMKSLKSEGQINKCFTRENKLCIVIGKDVDLITLDNQITDWMQEYIAPDYFEEKRIIQEQEDLKEYKDSCYDEKAKNNSYFNNLL